MTTVYRACVRTIQVQKIDIITPVVNLEPGNGVEFDNICDSIHGRGISDCANHENNAEVRHDDRVTLIFREKNRVD